MPSGIIVKGIGGFYYIKYENGICECKAKGKFRNQKIIPIIGDNVCFDINHDGNGIITEIKERKNFLVRPPVANIDQVILFISITHPEPNMLVLDKMICMFESKNIDVVICINKIDLDEDESYKKLAAIYENAGYPVVCISAKNNIGVNKLIQTLQNKCSVLAGNSGVGKSTLLNLILQEETVETGELSEKIERGKHTTRHVEIFEIKDGGYILDTPGFSSFQFNDIKKEDLKFCFKEFKQFNNNCRYTGCNHFNNEDCAIVEAIDNGVINIDRYERYKAIFSELKDINQYK